MNIKNFRCLESWDRPDFGFRGGVSECECLIADFIAMKLEHLSVIIWCDSYSDVLSHGMITDKCFNFMAMKSAIKYCQKHIFTLNGVFFDSFTSA